MQRVVIDYFTDVLCIWAYGAGRRLERLRQTFGSQVDIRFRYLPVFADARERVRAHGPGEEGFENFREHLRGIAAGWEHVALNPEVWDGTRPLTSINAHLYLKAARLVGTAAAAERLDWAVRVAFFAQARDVSDCRVLDAIAAEQGFDVEPLRDAMETGRAQAALFRDLADRELHAVPGSPTMVLNEGRQRLYGNLGYGVIEANVRELLRNPDAGEASWC